MYFITCLERVPTFEDNGGHTRTFGFFKEILEAEKALKENRLDMHECMYDYAVIEFIKQGIHPYAQVTGWFKYDKETDSFQPTKIEKHPYVNFALG